MTCLSELPFGRSGRLGMVLVYGPTARKLHTFCNKNNQYSFEAIDKVLLC